MAILATPLKAKYNPSAYVYGGAPTNVAKAIQAQGYRTGGYTSAYKPGLPPPDSVVGNAAQGGQYATPPKQQINPNAPSSQAAASGGVGGVLPSGMPGEGVYAADSAAAYDAYNQAVAASEKDSASARAQYGFNAEGSNLDPYNSTGLMQRLMHQQSQTSMADRESALGSGLGTTGLGAQQAESHDFQNQADLADTTNSYQAMLAQALGRKSDAGTTLRNALLQARQAQLQNDLMNQMFTAWSSGGGDGTGDGTGGAFTGTGPGEVTDQAAWDQWVAAHPEATKPYVPAKLKPYVAPKSAPKPATKPKSSGSRNKIA